MNTPITVQEVMLKTPKKFWRKILFGNIDQCWQWMAGRSKGGYGQFNILGKTKAVHRFVFIQLFDEPKAGLCVLHKCDNRSCVNPNHLFTGTKKDNYDDMVSKGRSNHPGAPGSKNGNAKLSEEHISVIKNRLGKGETLKSIGESFGVNLSVIWGIKVGRGWKHVKTA